MATTNKKLLLSQMDAKMHHFVPARQISVPPVGWIRAIRLALGMTLQQLAKRLNVSKQSVQHLEKREAEGAVTIQMLREVAQALDMELVYGFVPRDGSLEAMVEKKAREMATAIVLRTSNTMKLEDQGVSKERIKKAIEERTARFKYEMPKMLWD